MLSWRVNMSSFTSPAILEILDNLSFRVVQPFEFYVGESEATATARYSVPMGFVTDLASIPRVLWALLPPHGRYAKAAILHDYLLTKVQVGELPRPTADAIFYEAMLVLNVPIWQAWLMYQAVALYTRIQRGHYV